MADLEDFIDDLDLYFYELKLKPNIDNLPEELKDFINFFNARLNFTYGYDVYTDNPFAPLVALNDGKHSVMVEDLNDSDIDKVKSIIACTKNQIILGKLYDILGIKCKNKDYKSKAAEIYYEYAKVKINDENNNSSLLALKRSLYLFYKTKSIDKLRTCIDELFFSLDYISQDKETLIKYYIAEFLSEFKKNLLKNYIAELERLIEISSKSFGELHLKIIEILISYYKPINSISDLDKWQNKFADICEDLNAQFATHGYKYLNEAIAVLDQNRHADRINKLRFMIDKAQQKMFDSMNFVEHSLDDDINTQIEKKQKEVINDLKKLKTGSLQFLYLLQGFNAVKITEINKAIQHSKHSIRNYVNEVFFDDDKKIIYESSKASKEQKLEYTIAEVYRHYGPLYHALILRPFIDNLIFDTELQNLIKDILNHNLFVPVERRDIVYAIIEKGLNNNIRASLYELISQFENGCRDFLKTHRGLYPVITRGDMDVKIDLNHMLVKKGASENKFRDAIQEIIGKDLILQIEFLSCRSLSGNLRNRNYHYGYSNPDMYSCDEMVLFFLLIKVYCMGYDNELE